MSLQEDELPVLNAVVESGNPSIIQSTRMGNEVLRELETLRQDSARRCPSPLNQDAQDTHPAPGNTSESAKLPADAMTDESTSGQSQDELIGLAPDSVHADAPGVEIPEGLDFASLAIDAVPVSNNPTNFSFSDDELELLIDDIVDRHITELRQDIKQLLERARRTP